MNETQTEPGLLYAVGVGPGDPELLTLKAHKILSRVPAIFVPQTAEDGDSLALSVISRIAGVKEKIVGLVLPMTRDEKLLEKSWEAAAGRIWERLVRGEEAAFHQYRRPSSLRDLY